MTFGHALAGMRGKGAGVCVMWRENMRAMRDSQDYQYQAPPPPRTMLRVRAMTRPLVTSLDAPSHTTARAWLASFHT